MKIINNTNPDEIISELNNSIKISTEHLNKYKKQKKELIINNNSIDMKIKY